jgi:chaperone modulatory protein CbpM
MTPMTDRSQSSFSAEIVTADITCSLDELCLACNVDADWVAALIEHGAVEVEVSGAVRSEWTFARLTAVRIAKAKRLERDLGLNLPGVALALELLDEIEALRSQLATRRNT